ncbi:protein trichome birefringence-like 18 [Gossypium arboreum]|uniref:protein trichome birefringence-like 18 n=1 Tax=Gossypium arboreum TaxID=29729 RepID=UPI0008190D7C|nr:protein trichome birefringence-like 18 [Gossypium arboreum]XP_017610710.1 protein trichome birefringence-like 18 [Gossypium arboreum]
MTLASSKTSLKMAAFPRGVSFIAASMALLAMFLIFASWLLVSYPITSTVSEYISGVNRKIVLPVKDVSGSSLEQLTMTSNSSGVDNSEDAQVSIRSSVDKDSLRSESNKQLPTTKDSVDLRRNEIPEEPVKLPESSFGATEKKVDTSSSASSNASESNSVESGSLDSRKNGVLEKPGQLSESLSRPTEKKVDTSSSASSNASENNSVDSGCDLYDGKWFYDPQGPSYTNSSCPIITQMQNCQGNGRPDKDYENWRWKPSQCDLPRFDAKKFLELMRGKTLAFIGDSVARNQMESMLCLLWQVEVPKNRGNRRMHRWYFKSTSVMIVRVWSSWLVRQTNEKFDFAPKGVTKLHLDAPDDNLMELIPKFDVIVLSSGHWFAKQSVYVLSNEIVGGQLWWPDRSRPMKVNNVDAFGISVETILSALVTHPNYTGLTIVRSFSPDHYEGGAWNTGGSCTGKVKPLATDELVENGFTSIMHKKQVMGFELAFKKGTNKSKLRMMDITKVFGYRHDGHPGPFRSPDPNKITKVGPDGKPPPQDCLHWCMPGPVDTWNELVLEIIRRDFEGHQNFP